MKKIIFFGVIILIVFILIFSFKKDKYSNKYIDYSNNIFIEYPYIKDSNINEYINSYISNNIDNSDYLFIDYDLVYNNLILYTYLENNNIIKTNSKTFFVNNSNNDNIDYDFLNSKINDKNKIIALTFDDGPNHNTNRVLDILEKYGIVATFFILGINIDGNEKIIKRMNSLGMEIGNHMYSHSITTRLSISKIKEEISKTDSLIYNIIGKYPTLIRPSYGIYNKKLENNVNRPIVLWNIDTLDWKYHNSNGIANRVFDGVKNGNIILMHDIYNATSNSLEIIIPKLLEMGYKFVRVSDLLY